MIIKNTYYYSHAIVLYSDGERKGVLKLLKKDFVHCQVIMVVDDEKSLRMRMINGCLIIMPIKTKSINRYAKLFKYAQEIEVRNIEAETGQIIFLGVKTCVGFAKALLNIKKALILTPYQLYKHLDKQILRGS